MLNYEEMQLISDLAKHQGYLLLLKHIETSAEGLTTALEKVNLGPQSDEILIQWRMIRRILHVLKTAPENVKQLLFEELEANPAFKMQRENSLPS